MVTENKILFVFLLLIKLIISIPSNSYYLIDLDNNLSLNNSYCSNLFTNDQLYRIPRQCHKHLLCDPYYCDDKSFRCIKIRETLCCLYNYFQKTCEKENFIQMKDQFRSIYFHISIEHGYCEINLERIEKNDHSYCIADYQETTTTTTTTTSSPRLSFRNFHRYHHRLTTRPNRSVLSNFNYIRREIVNEKNISSKSSFIYSDLFFFIILLYTFSLFQLKI
jgi:hypothetical protein